MHFFKQLIIIIFALFTIANLNAQEDRTPILKTKGAYGSLVGGNTVSAYAFGFDFGFSAGYLINNYIGIGLGAELVAPNLFRYISAPLFLEARGYLLKKPTSPYYTVSAGYNFPFRTRLRGDYQINTKVEGGLFLRSGIGLRVGSHLGFNFIFDLSYALVAANYHYKNVHYGHNEGVDKQISHHVTFRCGVLF